MTMPRETRDEVAIVLCAEAGHGLETGADVLARLLTAAGYHVFTTAECLPHALDLSSPAH